MFVRKILAYGFGLDANFGGPSVVHGIHDALNHVFPKNEFVVYQPLAVDPVSVSDLDFPVRAFPYRKHMFKFYRDWLLLKLFGRRSRSESCSRFWDEYRAADAVVNIYAICFCSKIRTHLSVQSLWGAVRALFCEFGPNLLARLDGKVSVKSTASYGPFGGRPNRLLAKLATRFAFTRALVREPECLEEISRTPGRFRRSRKKTTYLGSRSATSPRFSGRPPGRAMCRRCVRSSNTPCVTCSAESSCFPISLGTRDARTRRWQKRSLRGWPPKSARASRPLTHGPRLLWP